MPLFTCSTGSPERPLCFSPVVPARPKCSPASQPSQPTRKQLEKHHGRTQGSPLRLCPTISSRSGRPCGDLSLARSHNNARWRRVSYTALMERSGMLAAAYLRPSARTPCAIRAGQHGGANSGGRPRGPLRVLAKGPRCFSALASAGPAPPVSSKGLAPLLVLRTRPGGRSRFPAKGLLC